MFRSQADAELTKKIYRRVPVLIKRGQGETGNPWGISFLRMFDMANDSGLFRTHDQLRGAGGRFDGWSGLCQTASAGSALRGKFGYITTTGLAHIMTMARPKTRGLGFRQSQTRNTWTPVLCRATLLGRRT